MGTIPVSLDRVTCGNIERACLENAKYVILLGVNDGLIPKAPSSASLLSDMDRDKLDALGVELKAYGAERLLMEQETLYRALACPTDELLLSWHLTDASGGETRPSYFCRHGAGSAARRAILCPPDRDRARPFAG